VRGVGTTVPSRGRGIFQQKNTCDHNDFCYNISMPKNRIILVLGVIIALLPVLGFPRSWEAFFQVLAGLAIVLLTVWSTIDKKLMLKHKAQLRASRKTVEVDLKPGIVPPVTPTYGKRVTDFYPRTAPPGRRLSDINPIIKPESEEPKE
jgi:hypothetical protein